MQHESMQQTPQQTLQKLLQAHVRQSAALLPRCCRTGAASSAIAELHAQASSVAALGSYCGRNDAASQSGPLLAKVVRKLLHQQQDATAHERLLIHAFRLLQLLSAAPLAALQDTMVARIGTLARKLQTVEPAAAGELAVVLRELHLLQTYPGFDVQQKPALPASTPPALSAAHPETAELHKDGAQLLGWQYALERYRQPASAALQQLLQQVPAIVARHCREADWTLAGYCGSRAASALQQLELLPYFSGDARALLFLRQHGAMLLDFHLAGQRPATAVLQQWLQTLYRYLQQGDLPAADTNRETVAAPGNALPPSASAELLHWQTLLAQALQAYSSGQAGGAETLQRVLYKPGWVLLALGLPEPARLFRCAWQLLAQYRHLGRTLPPELPAQLQQFGVLPGSAAAMPPPATLQRWQRQLLRLWPVGLRDDKLDIPLALPRASGPRLVMLAAVPDLLSSSFNTLTAIAQDWFQSPLPQARCTAVLAELALLEKGAAAMQVWPLEQLCTLLLDVYGSLNEAGHAPPAALLWHAHQHLLRMLDQAAAWQEPQRDDALLQQLQAWLTDAAGQAQQVCEAAPGSLQQLQARLRHWLLTLAGVVEKPVRLQITGTPPGEQVCTQVEAGLKPLLKFLLLDNAADVASRRAVHRPRISTFEIAFTVCGQALQVEVCEDSQAPVLEAQRLQQLQRALPATAGRLQCETVRGMGRRLRFTLPAG